MSSLVAASCDDAVDPEPVEVTVMTRNLFLGSGLTSTLATTPLGDVPAAVAQVWSNVLASDFPARARLIADEIAEASPDLVGLQEASLYRRQSPGDVLEGNPVGAADVELDFLEILLAELDVRGAVYAVGIVSENADVELPLARAGGGLDDLRLTDRDAILVRSGLTIADARAGFFAANLSIAVADVFTLNVIKGWTSVLATYEGLSFRFWNTHLETAEEGPAIQVAQGAELVQRATRSDEFPVVLVGDFNSDAAGSSTPTYGNILDAGFGDAWAEARGADPGFTCCQPSDLTNPESQLDRRLDLVFTGPRGRAVSALLVGADPAIRTPSGLWPSDHAGVVATVRLRRP